MFLSDIADINPETKRKFDDHEHINYLDTSNITNNFIDNFHSLVVGKDKIPSRAKRKVRDKDLVYSTVRPNNKHFGFLNDPPEDLIVSTGFVVIRVDPKKANPRFVYEYLTQDKFTSHMQNIGEDSTSTYPGIKPDDLLSIDIDLPSKKTQDLISAFATKIDNKIKFNKKINETLEEIARIIFKSWFIKFDPVRPKVDGRPTGLPKEISDLFPHSFVDSELGEIPEGFKVDSVDNQYDISIGKTPPRHEFQWFSRDSQDIPWASIKDMGDAGAYISRTSEYLTNDAVEKFNIRVIPKNNVIFSFKLTIGRVSILRKSMCTNEAIAHFVPKNDHLSEFFTYCLLTSLRNLSSSSTSSIGTAVNSKIIKAMKLVFPSKSLLLAFDEFCCPIFKKIEINTKKIETLVALRGILLPRLISGEFKISDAEKWIEGAEI